MIGGRHPLNGDLPTRGRAAVYGGRARRFWWRTSGSHYQNQRGSGRPAPGGGAPAPRRPNHRSGEGQAVRGGLPRLGRPAGAALQTARQAGGAPGPPHHGASRCNELALLWRNAGGSSANALIRRLRKVALNARCPPWRAKRRRVVPGSREATRDTRRAEGAKGDPKGASERGVQSYGRPVCSRNELAMLWRNAG